MANTHFQRLWYDHESFYGLGFRLRVSQAQYIVLGWIISCLTFWLILRLLRFIQLFRLIVKLYRHVIQAQRNSESYSEKDDSLRMSVSYDEDTATYNFENTDYEADSKSAYSYGIPSPRITPLRVGGGFFRTSSGFLIASVIMSYFIARLVYGLIDGGNWEVPILKDCCPQSVSEEYVYSRRFESPEVVHERAELARRVDSYVERCYNNNSLTALDPLCKWYARGSISYTATSNTVCPFEDMSMCWQGDDSGFSLDTGYQSVAELGINAEPRFVFRRQLQGVPMKINATSSLTTLEFEYGEIARYIRVRGEKGVWLTVSEDSATMRQDFTTGDPYIYQYTTRTHISREGSVWMPHPDVYGTKWVDAVTLVLISGGNSILHEEPQMDPIYPASFNISDDDGEEDREYYFKGVTAGTVLGLVEKQEICDTRTGKCWSSFFSPDEVLFYDQKANETNFYNDLDDEGKAIFNTVFYTLKASLASNFFEQDVAPTMANRNVDNGEALRTDDDLWKKEVTKAFEWMLAGAQIRMADAARGETQGIPFYEKGALNDQRRITCGRRGFVKVMSTDMDALNIQLSILGLYLTALGAIFLAMSLLYRRDMALFKASIWFDRLSRRVTSVFLPSDDEDGERPFYRRNPCVATFFTFLLLLAVVSLFVFLWLWSDGFTVCKNLLCRPRV